MRPRVVRDPVALVAEHEREPRDVARSVGASSPSAWRRRARSPRPSASSTTSSTLGQRRRSTHFSEPLAHGRRGEERSSRSTTCTNWTPNASQERTTAAPLCGSCGASKTTWTLASRAVDHLAQALAPTLEDERLEQLDDALRVVASTRAMSAGRGRARNDAWGLATHGTARVLRLRVVVPQMGGFEAQRLE